MRARSSRGFQLSHLAFLGLIFHGFTGGVPGARAAEEHPFPLTRVYKTIRDVSLSLTVYQPAPSSTAELRPALVFFFGGGWTKGNPSQFEPHCRHFAQLGLVGITVDYRVRDRHGTTPLASIADARSAIRWVRAHSASLGVDPNRIAASGGSAGGHLAAAAAFIDAFDEPSDDKSVSAVPNALILFNPALDTGRLRTDRGFGTEAERASPLHHVKPGAPPTIIFHGTADETVPFEVAESFTKRMLELGSRCELVPYEGRGHGFFNHREGKGKDYPDTIRRMEGFLREVGFLQR